MRRYGDWQHPKNGKSFFANLGLGPITVDVNDLERQLEDALQGSQVDIDRIVERKVNEMLRRVG